MNRFHFIHLTVILVMFQSSYVRNKKVIRVFGGEELHDLDKFKFLVKIDIYNKQSVFCTGSIIGERWIITAAHCFDKTNFKANDKIVASQIIEGYRTVIDRMTAENVIRHPNFNLLTEPAQYDLALLRTTKPLKFNNFVQPIQMGSTPLQFGQIIKLAGYGESDLGNEIPVEGATIVSKCGQQLIYTNVFCSYDIVGAGYGDSGGPLVADKKLVGIVSEGYCTAANHWKKCVTAYSSIPANLDWIFDTIYKKEYSKIGDKLNSQDLIEGSNLDNFYIIPSSNISSVIEYILDI